MAPLRRGSPRPAGSRERLILSYGPAFPVNRFPRIVRAGFRRWSWMTPSISLMVREQIVREDGYLVHEVARLRELEFPRAVHDLEIGPSLDLGQEGLGGLQVFHGQRVSDAGHLCVRRLGEA